MNEVVSDLSHLHNQIQGSWQQCSRMFQSFWFICRALGVLQAQKTKVLSDENYPKAIESSPFLKPGVGQNIAMHATPTTRNTFFWCFFSFLVRSASFSLILFKHKMTCEMDSKLDRYLWFGDSCLALIWPSRVDWALTQVISQSDLPRRFTSQ